MLFATGPHTHSRHSIHVAGCARDLLSKHHSLLTHWFQSFDTALQTAWSSAFPALLHVHRLNTLLVSVVVIIHERSSYVCVRFAQAGLLALQLKDHAYAGSSLQSLFWHYVPLFV